MSVWRKKTVRYFKNGKRSEKGVKGASPQTEESKRWYGTLTTYDGKKKQVPLTEDKDTSEDLLKRLQRTEDERRAKGFTKIDEEREKSIWEHLDDFKSSLQSKNNTPIHVRTTVNRVKALLEALAVKTVTDLDGGKVLNQLAKWRKRKLRPMSVASSNHYLVAIKGFTRWLWVEKRTPEDVFVNLRKLNAQTDRRRIRRALTEEEAKTLMDVTLKSKKTYFGSLWRLKPSDRVLLYSIALYTGLRSIEIASLKFSSFDLETKTISVEASNTKNRKKALLPIHPVLLELLRPLICGNPLPSPHSLVFGTLDPTQGIPGKVCCP